MLTLLSVENLSYRKNLKKILDDVNFSIPTNEIIGLLGANGAGKSSLMRLIAGAAKTYKGDIVLDGQTNYTERKRMVSFSEQLSGVNDSQKLIKIAEFYDRMFKDFVYDDFVNMSITLKLDLNQRLGQLSKGNRRKFVIAITLARKAKLYLLDEPFDGIDTMSRSQIIDNILKWKPEESTIIVSDHHVTDIESLIDQVIVIKDKKVVGQKYAEEIRSQMGQNIEEYYASFYQEEIKND